MAGDSHDAADDCSPWPADGRDRVPVRPVRHGRRADPDRGAADPDAAAVGDGAACDHADGVERLARAAVARTHQVASGLDLPDRMRGRAGGVVDHPLRAEQADGAVAARGDAIPGAADAVESQARSREHLAGHLLRLDLHGADADDRRLRAADGHLLSRRQIRPPRHRRDQGHLPGRQPFREADLFRRHHRPGRDAGSGSRRRRGGGVDDRHHAGAAHPRGDDGFCSFAPGPGG